MSIQFGEVQDAQAGAESLFRMPPGGQDRLHQLAGVRPDLFRPVLQALGRPLPGLLVFDRHVGGLGGIAAGDVAAGMNGHCFRFALVEDLDHPFRGTDPHFLVDQPIRDRVEMLLEFNVVVDIYPGSLVHHIFVRFFRQGPQIGAVDVFKLLSPRSSHCQHNFIVKLI